MTTLPEAALATDANGRATWPARVSWGAVVAGAVTVLSLHLVLMLLGIGLGLALVNPTRGESDLPEFSWVTGTAWILSMLLSCWAGGWSAGRMARRSPGNYGALHGVFVWAVAALILFAALARTGALAFHPATRALMPFATNASATPASRLIDQFIDEATAGAGNARNPIDARRDRRELVDAVQTHFHAPDAASRQQLIETLAQSARLSHADAAELTRAWEMSHERARSAATAQAGKTARALSMLAAWAFLVFAVGAVAAAWGGQMGAERAAALCRREVMTAPSAN